VIPVRVGEPIIGARAWLISARRTPPQVAPASFGSLLPLNWGRARRGGAWPPGQAAQAYCAADPRSYYGRHAGSRQAPEEQCRCGLYAARSLDWVAEVLFAVLADARRSFSRGVEPACADERGTIWLAAGTVKLWGKVIEGQRGWRVGRAYPDRIALLPPVPLRREAKFDEAATQPEIATGQELVAAVGRQYGCPVVCAQKDGGFRALIESGPLRSSFFARAGFANAVGSTTRAQPPVRRRRTARPKRPRGTAYDHIASSGFNPSALHAHLRSLGPGAVNGYPLAMAALLLAADGRWNESIEDPTHPERTALVHEVIRKWRLAPFLEFT
jgi:hypothetical protein